MKFSDATTNRALGALLFSVLPFTIVDAQSVAYLQESNNDRVIALHRAGCLNSQHDSEVTLQYFGNMAFLITSPCGLRIMVDPWRNDPGIWGLFFHWDFPPTQVDVALVTHAHSDHDAIHRLDAAMVLDRMSGEFVLGDVRILGIPEKHVCVPQGVYAYRSAIIAGTGRDPCPPHDTTQWNNVLFVIETGGLRILHWGDNRQNPPQSVWDRIGDIDVAILPIDDGGHILSAEWTDRVIEKLGANIVIPSHYYIERLNNPHWFFNKSADEWVAARKHTLLDTGTLTLTKARVAQHDSHVMYFGNHIAPKLEYPTSPPGELDRRVPEPIEAWKQLVK
jgi:L-ascorbate metabolism protein UlaG (beta-lactamase superfamily)